ncbi:DNA oxidative demethylase AlkB [Candidatus Igneacidithiobacillus taiwanensis]|uniref:DNA oxidative demethylase AlkB n=1 Tax=Candidatus Igneacidithiobacillus taiwanensis TaxID=1945924 RepID=UPI00289C5A9D|nr:DNA oxidative demethylase AlkB [Candidatus Igneacidithiobacillus taiwanensis]MCE5360246.1 DNA oxidative demethylase AlkB [Acidithiobacillus sp.]
MTGNTDLFDEISPASSSAIEVLEPGAMILRRWACESAPTVLELLQGIWAQAPLRQMQTPGGKTLSAQMSNCGTWGWVSDRRGYRYEAEDPLTKKPWPPLPKLFAELATKAAAQAGYPEFLPDACLINVYAPGAKMGLHQDRDEEDFLAPIVSFSLGLSATFLWGGKKRTDPTQKILLTHGDVLIWGAETRLHYHGIVPVKVGEHPLVGEKRINLTFRKAHK